MIQHWMVESAALGLLLAAATLGLLFGSQVARYRHMVAALEAVETCETDSACEAAWVRLQLAKGGK